MNPAASAPSAEDGSETGYSQMHDISSNTCLEETVCYICYEGPSADKPFCGQTCECKGSIHIHSKCLFDLRRTTSNASNHCTICKQPYKPLTPGHLTHTPTDHNLIYVEYVNGDNIRLEYSITPDGKPHGQMYGYYLSGRKHSISSYLYGELYGPSQLFEDSYENNVTQNMFYKANKRHGCGQVYFKDVAGHILYKLLHYKHGQLEGACFEYNRDGIIVKEYNYKEGVLDGIYKEYNNTGILQKRLRFSAGRQLG